VSGSTTKRVLVERFDRETVAGYVNPQSFLQGTGVELIRPDGSIALFPLDQIKCLCFVRDLDGLAVSAERRQFLVRPKAAGLWVELRFRDGERLEGLIPNNLLQLDTTGFSITPPDAAGNTQRVYVPRQALAELVVLGVIGSPARRRPREPERPQQIRLFPPE
jgi:hypothetical protein